MEQARRSFLKRSPRPLTGRFTAELRNAGSTGTLWGRGRKASQSLGGATMGSPFATAHRLSLSVLRLSDRITRQRSERPSN